MRFVAVIALAVTLAFAAGCGGEASAGEAWAGDVCSALGDWQNEVSEATDDIREQLQAPGEGTVAAIEGDVRTAVDATNQLVDDLRELDPPETESGEQAEQQVDALAAQLEGTADTAQQAVESLPSGAGLTEIAQTLAPLLPALQSLASNAERTLAAIQASGGELREGFEQADSCERFR